MARRRVSPDQRKDYCHSVYFYREEYYRVSRLAIRHDKSIAQFLREAALEKAAKEEPVEV